MASVETAEMIGRGNSNLVGAVMRRRPVG
jgi:hypothetical protein